MKLKLQIWLLHFLKKLCMKSSTSQTFFKQGRTTNPTIKPCNHNTPQPNYRIPQV